MTDATHGHDPSSVPAPRATGRGVELPVGMPIYSRDGQHLGRVKQVREGCFLVDVRLAFDYWLSRRCVAAVAGGHVRLAVDKRAVADYLVDADCPDDDAEEDAVVAVPADPRTPAVEAQRLA